MPQRKKRLSALKEELKSREPALRGEAAQPKIQARHENAERAAALQLQHRQGTAAKHNAKAAAVPGETREKRQRQQKQQAAALESDMRAHSERHRTEVAKVKIRGSSEVSKVLSTLDAVRDAEQAAVAQAKRAQDDQMAAAQERHAFEVARVAAKGAAETQKVDRAGEKMQAKAEAQAEAHTATLEAAAERRAAILEATRAKAHGEIAKVNAWRSPQRAASPDSVVPDSSSPPAGGPGTATAQSKFASRRQGVSPPPPPAPPPPAVPSSAEVGVARGADMMLLLLRGGAPNLEVLNATTVDDFRALGRKYAIALPGGPDAD